ncbi:hypothetical protein [Rhizobium lusitanum]|uniref:hypothetical protein n=1 Tax=Rhizobium lusitanum TaxID=293958 RepID=UPI001571CC9F|nr:hypothetical protein [Rhizobium lusitanum]NTJ11489.1 hypothetical protein [Rhizobium lusitanum]
MILIRAFSALSIAILGPIAAIPASAAADPGDRPVTNALEDKSCSVANRAYERSHNSGRFVFKVYQLMSTGETDLYLECRVIDDITTTNSEMEPGREAHGYQFAPH